MSAPARMVREALVLSARLISQRRILTTKSGFPDKFASMRMMHEALVHLAMPIRHKGPSRASQVYPVSESARVMHEALVELAEPLSKSHPCKAIAVPVVYL